MGAEDAYLKAMKLEPEVRHSDVTQFYTSKVVVADVSTISTVVN